MKYAMDQGDFISALAWRTEKSVSPSTLAYQLQEGSMSALSMRLRLHAAALGIAGQLLIACSGSTDDGPSIPQIAGTYSVTESVPAATCDPNQLPAGGTVRLESFPLTYDVVINQTGSALTLSVVGFSDVEDGTIGTDSTISLSDQFAFEEAPREGNRIFFVDLTVQRDLQVQSTSRLAGTSSYVNVFREGSATAAVYTTCSRQGGTIELVRQ